MLDRWGYLYFVTANALTYAETALEQQRAKTGGTVAGHGTSILDPHGQEADLVLNQCREVLRIMQHYRDELGPIPFNLEVLSSKLLGSRKSHQLEMYTNDVLTDVRKILNDFRALLSTHKFYYLSQSLSRYYGKPTLFGEAITKKIPAASVDIERAGNCLALGEPTACILHLNRVMEIAIRRLAKKLKFEPKPKDTLGNVLRDMYPRIDALPEHTENLKRKKQRWSECRANLYHVKNAWRDPSSHGKVSYSEKEAHDIMKRVEEFMQQLATLL
jgi:hypothetical protein